MQLNPTERDRLLVFATAQLARETLSRGLPLNAPEAIALVCDEMHLAARGGASYEQVVDAGRTVAERTPVLDGVAAIASEIRVEVLLEEGSRLIVLRDPFGPGRPTGPAPCGSHPATYRSCPTGSDVASRSATPRAGPCGSRRTTPSGR